MMAVHAIDCGTVESLVLFELRFHHIVNDVTNGDDRRSAPGGLK